MFPPLLRIARHPTTVTVQLCGIQVLVLSDDRPPPPEPEPDGRWEDAGEKADAVIEWAGSPMWRWPRRDR